MSAPGDYGPCTTIGCERPATHRAYDDRPAVHGGERAPHDYCEWCAERQERVHGRRVEMLPDPTPFLPAARTMAGQRGYEWDSLDAAGRRAILDSLVELAPLMAGTS